MVTPSAKIMKQRTIAAPMSAPPRISRLYNLSTSPSYVCGGGRAPRSRKDKVLVLGPLGAGTSLVFIHPPCAVAYLWQKAVFELAPRGLTSIIGPGTFMNLPISSFEPEGPMVVLLMCPPRSFPRSYGRPTSLAYGGCACNVCILAPLNAPKYTGGSMGTYAPCGAASGPPESNRAERYGKSEVLRGS